MAAIGDGKKDVALGLAASCRFRYSTYSTDATDSVHCLLNFAHSLRPRDSIRSRVGRPLPGERGTKSEEGPPRLRGAAK